MITTREMDGPGLASEHRFAAPEADCDIIMKGGVTSGIVYPKAILALAGDYRFRKVGGTSAGGIAAAFTAAAEYARAKGDPDGFTRLEARCLALPDILSDLFQPEPKLAPLMKMARLALQHGFGGAAARLPVVFYPFALLGAAAGALLLAIFLPFGGGWSGVVLGAALGGLIGPVVAFACMATKGVAANDFGLCRGLSSEGAAPEALTNWLHDSLQYIAFADGGATRDPLTFGDLQTASSTHPIDLRMMTSNLSLRRPHALPEMVSHMSFEVPRWRRFFPQTVMTYLERDAVCEPDPYRPKPRGEPRQPPRTRDLRAAATGATMPVIIAVRMSLSFPFLISAIPMKIRDIGKEQRLEAAQGKPPGCQLADVWLTDGGLTSNFPVHFFDGPLPMRPTFALSLDELPKGEPEPKSRVFLQKDAGAGIFLPILPVEGVAGFALSLLGTAKDWQDTLTAGMSGQRERIVRVSLSASEGGLNLDMPPEKSRKLMDYGEAAGQALADDFDFDEHRWRRALVAYEQLETVASATHEAWAGGFGTWFAGYGPKASSYDGKKRKDLPVIQARLDAFAKLGASFVPALRDTAGKFPRPRARTRIAPDV